MKSSSIINSRTIIAILFLSLVVALSSGLAGLKIVRDISSDYERYEKKEAQLYAEAIIKYIYNADNDDHISELFKVLELFKRVEFSERTINSKSIQNFAIFSNDLIVKHSINQDDIGKHMSSVAYIPDPETQDKLPQKVYIIRPIINKKECSKCHNEKRKIGMAYIEYSYENAKYRTKKYEWIVKNSILVSAIAIIFFMAVTILKSESSYKKSHNKSL